MSRTRKALPDNRVRCLVCGSCLQLDVATTAEAYRAWLSDHRDCRILKVPAAGCLVKGCNNTGIGPTQQCREHGGTLTRADVTPGGA